MSDIANIIVGAANRYGVDPRAMLRIGQIESGLRPDAQNRSGAAGLFQFMPKTAAQYGLANPLDPAASADAGARLFRDNAQMLRSALGRDPAPDEVYLAHQQGAGGATKLLSNPDELAANLVGTRAVIQNGGRQDMTAREFTNLWSSKYNRGTANAVPQPAPSGATADGVVGAFSSVPVPVDMTPVAAAQAVNGTISQQEAKRQADEQAVLDRRRALFGGIGGRGRIAGLFG